MKSHNRTLLRQAVAICEQYRPDDAIATIGQLPKATWKAASTIISRLRRARWLGWHRAARRLQVDLRATLLRLQSHLGALERQIPSPHVRPQRLAVRELFEDLRALYEEFEDVTFDAKSKTLAVTTEPIELESILLGRFEIQLDCSRLTGGPNTYRVVALDPNPAACNESVTHPHIQGEVVCEGDGTQPIRHALEEGRLFDFFTIVDNLLKTYNPESPYVSLSDWFGVECADCGHTIDEDDRRTCEKCDATVCVDCYVICSHCREILCAACVSQCEDCEQYFCKTYLTECSKCSVERCRGCLDENERCSDCHEEESEATEKSFDDEDVSTETGTTIHADRVGEAVVST